ncbi:MAG: DNA primase [Clostridia bacterium]|nr:DNA primase [Clostridia bacterium]
MRFSDDFLAELRSRTDIEELIGRYVEIRHRGSRTPVALCPFHSEKTPSFVIYRDTQSYYCFGCGAGGDAITFIKNIERLDYTDSVRFLCERAGLAMPLDPVDDEINRLRRRCYEANREAARFFHAYLYSPEAQQARAYLDKRRLAPETVKSFGLGFAPAKWDALIKHLKEKGYNEAELVSFDLAKRTSKGSVIDAFRNRLMFPIIDLRGNVIAFGGRVLDDSKPKYLNTSDTVVYKKSQALYALNFAKNNRERKLILCEGYMDVIAMHQAGFTNAVAGLGTAFTKEQVSLLSRYCDELTLCFDSDEAGKKATKRALSMLSSSPMKLKVMHLQDGKDPDEIIKTQGKEKMNKIISSAVNDTEFALNDSRSRFDISTEDGKLGFLNEAVAVLAAVENAIERDLYVSKLAEELNVQKSAIEQQIKKQRRFMKKAHDSAQFDAAMKTVLGDDKISSPNPEKKSNVRAVKAEEVILASLLKHPDYLKKLKGILEADVFVTEFGRRYFEDISSRIQSGRSLDLVSFNEDAENEEMAYLAYLNAKISELANSVEECKQCINTLIEEKAKKNAPDVGKLSNEEYRDLFRKKREKKKPEGV